MKNSIRNILNKIKWDSRESEKDYVIVYKDRFEGLNEIPFCQVIKILDKGINVLGDACIPYHRINLIKKRDEVVWSKKREGES